MPPEPGFRDLPTCSTAPRSSGLAGVIFGTHNGTIYNADYLFRCFKLRRFAHVDSELLFRLAHTFYQNDRFDINRFKARLDLCQGQMTAVLASRNDPETILVLKGNKPLVLWTYHEHDCVQARGSHGVLKRVS